MSQRVHCCTCNNSLFSYCLSKFSQRVAALKVVDKLVNGLYTYELCFVIKESFRSNALEFYAAITSSYPSKPIDR